MYFRAPIGRRDRAKLAPAFVHDRYAQLKVLDAGNAIAGMICSLILNIERESSVSYCIDAIPGPPSLYHVIITP